MAALPQLTRLTSLKLALDDDEQAACALAQLTCLRQLRLYCDELQGQLLSAILQLAGLTELVLCADTLPPVRQLARLSQLRKLFIDTADFVSVELELPETAQLPAGLEDFFVSTAGGALQASSCCRCSCLLLCLLSPVAVSSSPSTVLLFPRLVFCELQVAGAEFTKCHLRSCATAEDHQAGQQSVALDLANVRSLPSLARLLGTLIPPAACLRELVAAGPLNAAAFAGCTRLQQLTALSINSQWFRGSSWQQATATLLQQATGLAVLALDGGSSRRLGLGQVPPCLAAYRGLTQLTLQRMALEDLADGLYLTGGSRLAGMMLLLVAFMRTCAAAGCMLDLYPAMRYSDVSFAPPFADLRSLNLEWNDLARLPPALSAATRLTRLSLDWNRQLRLWTADVATLLRLPRLLVVNAVRVRHKWRSSWHGGSSSGDSSDDGSSDSSQQD